jgi:hypothetical protein
VNSADIKTQVEHFCADICDALRRTWLSPDEQKRQVTAAARRHDDETRQMAAIAGAPAAAIPAHGSDGSTSAVGLQRVTTSPAAPAAAWRLPGRALAIGGLAFIATALIAAIVISRLTSGAIAPAPNVTAAPSTTTAPGAEVSAPQSTPAPAQSQSAPAAIPAAGASAPTSLAPPSQGEATPAATAPEPAPPSAAAAAPSSANPAAAPQARSAPPRHRPYHY